MKKFIDWQSKNRKEKSLLLRCKVAVEKLVPGVKIILYGSHARQEAAPESDYDLLILLDNEISEEMESQIGNVLYDIELDIGVIISSIIFNKKNWNDPLHKATPLYENIDNDGVEL